MSHGPVATDGFRHEAFVYTGEQDFLAGAVPFVAEAVDAGEPVLVALPGLRVDLVREALGSRAAGVQFLRMEEVGRNPARIIPAWRDFIDARPLDGRPVRGVGEPLWADRAADEVAECHLHESLLNDAFHATPRFTLLCPYDASTLAPAVVDQARRTHPAVRERGARTTSPVYAAHDVREQHFRASLPEPPLDAVVVPLDGMTDKLPTLRRVVARHGSEWGLDGVRVEDLVLAVDEIAINAVRHGGSDPTLTMWREGDRVVCEARDRGLMNDAMVGRVHPGHASTGGRGLWIVNQLCDLVQIRSSPEGTVVRIHIGPDEQRA